jgi:hypothetical protein
MQLRYLRGSNKKQSTYNIETELVSLLLLSIRSEAGRSRPSHPSRDSRQSHRPSHPSRGIRQNRVRNRWEMGCQRRLSPIGPARPKKAKKSEQKR